MYRIFLLSYLISTIAFVSQAQVADHWETAVYDSTLWKYFPGNSDPGADWAKNDYDDNAWQSGKGGFGFGDSDDTTILQDTHTIYIRKKITIEDRSKITDALLHVDYDDGFIVYLNGTEIARMNMAAGVPHYNDYTTTTHEAVMYAGLPPEKFALDDVAMGLLSNGENLLAIEVHDANATSSDLTIRAFLSFGIVDNSTLFYTTPPWFTTPMIFESSNLPIVIIDTHGQIISDEPSITADMAVIDNQVARNNVTDPHNNYEGKIDIEVRGESSQMFPKKSFKVTTVDDAGADRNVSLLGMPLEHSWILYAPYTDKTMMRDVLSYMLGNKMGHYATRTKFCEVVINGDYMGVYVLMEKIKRDKSRVDIAKLTEVDTEGDDLTGGYILRVDKLDANDFPAWQSNPVPQLPNEKPISFQYVDPDGEDLLPVQKTYIKNYILELQSSITSSDFKNEKTGYRKYLDVASFVDFMMVNEVNKNIDAYVYSTYMYKDKDSKGGKLKMGPLWDFNLAFGNVDYLANAQFAPGWMYSDGYRMFWFRRLMQDPYFSNQFTCRWLELRQHIFNTNSIHSWIDSTANVLEESQIRNYEKWPILGTYIWPNQYVGQTYSDEISFLKDWITKRLDWMDKNLLKTCKQEPPAPVTSVEEAVDGAFTLYPNPSSEEFHFVFESRAVKRVEIYGTNGELIFSSPVSGPDCSWDGKMRNGMPASGGIYIYRVITSNKVFTGKVIKR